MYKSFPAFAFPYIFALLLIMFFPREGESFMLNTERPAALVERCSSIIVGKKATKDGSVLLAHNEDLANYSAHHYVYRARITH